jgi:SAM-dependent methyltransferase
LERVTAGWFENFLLQQWIPAMPNVRLKLEQGARFADVGCGRGRALIKLAQAFPKSTYIGFDIFEPTIERATRNAVHALVKDRVRFKALDASKGLPEKFDVIATFDVVHDAVDPVGLLRAIRDGLKDDGIYICLDINARISWSRTWGRSVRYFMAPA